MPVYRRVPDSISQQAQWPLRPTSGPRLLLSFDFPRALVCNAAASGPLAAKRSKVDYDMPERSASSSITVALELMRILKISDTEVLFVNLIGSHNRY